MTMYPKVRLCLSRELMVKELQVTNSVFAKVPSVS